MLRMQKHAAMSILIFNIVPLGITIFSADLLLIIPGVSDKFQLAAHKITALLPCLRIYCKCYTFVYAIIRSAITFMQITHQIQVFA